MKREQIIATFRSLARSQGFYGRLLDAIFNLDEDERDEYFTALEEQNFAGPLDLVLFIEG